jgi:hypothetical protein
VPLSAVDAIPIAFRHTSDQIFKPFRFGQWNRLAFVGLLAGELSSSGGCNIPSNFPHQPHGSQHFVASSLPNLGIDPAALAALIAVIAVSALVLGIVFMYISSVMRFILFDSVLVKECRIGEGWNQRQGEGLKYFVFKLIYLFATFVGVGVLVGFPAALAFGLGWLRQPKEHVGPLVIFGVLVGMALVAFLLLSAIVFVLTKDFVIPQMALEGIGVVESWQRLWAMMDAEKGSYAAYIAMKIVLAIAAGIAVSIVTVILGFIIAIPTIALSVIAIITGKSAGLTWDVYTISLAVVVGSILLAIFLYLVSLISVPVIVFFPAYSIYFFAGRYPRLAAALQSVAGLPAQEPPPAPLLPSNPEPIG